MLVLQEQAVEVFFLAGFFEWENALDDDEEDDSDGEHVDVLALVSLALLDLGGHVGHRAAVRAELVDVLVAGEAEVGDFQVEVVVDEDVFELEVAVDNPATVHVLERVQHLVQEEPTRVLSHGSHGLAEVEKEAALDELHDDVDEVFDDAAAGLDDLAGVAVLVHVDDSRMLQVLQNGDFVVH